MPVSLLYQTLARIDENKRKVRRRGTRHHVTRILDVTRRIGNYKLPLRSGEIPVSHIDGDALLALRLQSVCQQRKVDIVKALFGARLLHSLQLIFEDRFTVIQQPPDERALPVIHTPRGRKSK